MKELSVEEKAKAYDEALRYAMIYYKEGNEDMKMMMKTCFPALVEESEDERIRKAITEYLRQRLDRSPSIPAAIGSWLAWLEKQGEQKPADKVEPKFKVKYAGSEYNVFETKDIAGVTFYGIEDEPNHIDYVKAENCEIIGGYGIKENGSLYPTKPAKFSEQNHAWSEEDEKEYKYVLKFVDNILNNCGNKKDYEHCKRCYDWLKSLKQRIGGEL